MIILEIYLERRNGRYLRPYLLTYKIAYMLYVIETVIRNTPPRTRQCVKFKTS